MSLFFRILLMVLLGLAGSGLSGAEEPANPRDAEARRYFQSGKQQFEEGYYEEAIVAWRMAYEYSPERHQLLFNIASAQEKLGLWQEALDSLIAYRTHADSTEEKTIERRIVNLERRIAEQRALDTAPVSPGIVLPDPPEVPSKPVRTYRTRTGLVLTGSGATALGIGLALGARSVALKAQALEGCVDTDDGLLCTDGVSNLVQRQRGLALGADLSMGVGALVTAGGTFVLIKAQF